MKLSGELDYRIRYDVEHNLFHVKNVFNDEYITPTFVEYVQKLEKENQDLRDNYDQFKAIAEPEIERFQKENAELKEQNIKDCENFNKTMKETNEQWNEEHCQLTTAKELLKMALDWQGRCGNGHPTWQEVCVKIEQFLKDSEVEK